MVRRYIVHHTVVSTAMNLSQYDQANAQLQKQKLEAASS